MSEAQETPNRSSRGEWISFGILAAILAGVVIVVALVLPLIFGHIVPAILKDPNAVPTLPAAATEEPAGVDPVEATPTPSAEEVSPEATEPAPVEAVEATEEAMPAESETEEVVAPAVEDVAETAVPANSITHTVQRGETLTHIAKAYGVSVAQILASNSIPNPNRIGVGTVLNIPQP